MGQAKGRLTSVAKFQTSLTGFRDEKNGLWLPKYIYKDKWITNNWYVMYIKAARIDEQKCVPPLPFVNVPPLPRTSHIKPHPTKIEQHKWPAILHVHN